MRRGRDRGRGTVRGQRHGVRQRRRDGSGRGAAPEACGESGLGGRTAARTLVAVGAYVVQDVRDAEALMRPFLRRTALRLALSPREPARRLGGAYLRLDPPTPSEVPAQRRTIEVGATAACAAGSPSAGRRGRSRSRQREAGVLKPHPGPSRMTQRKRWRRRAESNRRWMFCRRLSAVSGSSAACAIVLHSPKVLASVRAGLCWRVLSREEASRRRMGGRLAADQAF